MMRKDFLVIFAVALGSGLLGGLCAGILFGNALALGQNNGIPVGNIRTQKLELVDKEGTVRGGFYMKDNGYPVLFVGSLEDDSITLNLSKEGPSLILTKPSETLSHRDVVLRVSDAASGISFYQGDSGMEMFANVQTAQLNISSPRPGLTLRGPYNSPPFSTLPAFPSTALTIDSGGANLSLYDAKGRRRIVLGSAQVEENPNTGSETTYPLPSLVFFAKDGEVLWQAP